MNTPVRSLPVFAYLSPLVGLATGYGATMLESRFAPVGLFPLLVGATTGLGVIACLRLAACGCRGGHVWAAVTAAIVAVGIMHYGSYRQALAASDAEWQNFQNLKRAFPDGQLNQMPTPLAGFGDFVRRELRHGRALGGKPIQGTWLVIWWTVDAVLLIAAAAGTAFFLSSPPPPDVVAISKESTA